MLPIILAHGIARFDILREMLRDRFPLPDNPLDDEFQYFRNIRTFLNANGFADVSNTNVDFAGPVSLRADQLKTQIDEILTRTNSTKVHIIAHSMGGLDARYMLTNLGMADRVASLTTIGTPHQGTVLADHIIGRGGNVWIEFMQKAVRLDLAGFKDLTTSACLQFNQNANDAEAKNSVFYQVFSSFQGGNEMFLPLVPSWFLIRGLEGRNDGLVPVRSQKWASELVAADGTRKEIVQNEFPIPADHLNQVGWWDLAEAVNPFLGGSLAKQRAEYEMKIKQVYLGIAQNLRTIPDH